MPSKSKAQHKLMEAASHGAKFPKAKNIPEKVAKDFVAADKGKALNKLPKTTLKLNKPAPMLGVYNKVKK